MTRVVRIQSRICVGGPALHSIVLSAGLSHRSGSRYDTVLLGGALEPGESSLEGLARERGVDLRLVQEMVRPVRPALDAAAVRRVYQLLRELRPSIVHTHTAKAGAIGRAAARLARVPVVVHTFHGHVFDGYFSPAKAAAFVQVERALGAMTDRILTVSEQQRAELVEKYRIASPDKVQVVPLGLELERFAAVPEHRAAPGVLRRALGLDLDTPLVVAVGRLVPVKRFDVLLSAFERVLAEQPAAHLAIAGDGDEEQRRALSALCRGREDRVHWLGWRKDLPEIYADADLLALTSDNEGTPVAVIEALTAGLPVVSTRVGGVEDVVRPLSGWAELAERGDAREIGEKIRFTLKRRARVPMDRREHMLARYSHRRLISDIEALYDELLTRRGLATHRTWQGAEGSAATSRATRGGAAC